MSGDLSGEVREKKQAALLSVGSAIVLVSLKTFLVVRTGSLGVLSEALHSGLDLVAAVITFLSVRVSDQPADENHPYGHGKFENFSAFVETALLLITALYIIFEAFERLFFRAVHIAPSLTAVIVLAFALIIDLTRATALAGVMLWGGSQLGKRTIEALLDTAPQGLQQEIARAVSRMEGVLDVVRVRVRRAGNRHFVDATVSVPRTASLEQVHQLSDAIEKRIGEIVPADVIVHPEPRAPKGEHLFEAIRAVAQRMGLAIHDVSAIQQQNTLFVELHLEVDENLSLRAAHRKATELEDGIRELRGGGPVDVNIHIEPLGRHIATPDTVGGEMKQLSRNIEGFLNSLTSEYDELVNCHDVRVRQVEHRILASCHCTMKSDLPITTVHDVTAALEDRVKEHFSQVHRVTIHPEPTEEA